MYLLRLVRLPNLLIVALTQWIIYQLISRVFATHAISVLLDTGHFLLFVLSTVIITAGGYIINDIVDYEIDLINKPDRVIIHKKISPRRAYQLYHGMNIFGFALSLYLAIHIGNLPLVLLFPAAVALLWGYSHRWKKQVLIGNLIVAFFCAFVAGIVFFAERAGFGLYLERAESPQLLLVILVFYSLFAFLSTLLREVVKDIEDFKGDMDNGCTTLPIRYGSTRAKTFALANGYLLLVLVLTWAYYQMAFLESWLGLSLVILLVVLPIVTTLVLLHRAQSKAEFHRVSQWAKVVMVAGILIILF